MHDIIMMRCPYGTMIKIIYTGTQQPQTITKTQTPRGSTKPHNSSQQESQTPFPENPTKRPPRTKKSPKRAE
jgi:hypothetical protein